MCVFVCVCVCVCIAGLRNKLTLKGCIPIFRLSTRRQRDVEEKALEAKTDPETELTYVSVSWCIPFEFLFIWKLDCIAFAILQYE